MNTGFDQKELDNLKDLAQKAEAVDFGQVVAHCENKAWANYIAAVSPRTVCALIAELEELRVNNYGPEILNDPGSVTAAYFAGKMAEGRIRDAKEDELLAKLRKCQEGFEDDLPESHRTRMEDLMSKIASCIGPDILSYQLVHIRASILEEIISELGWVLGQGIKQRS